MKVNATMAVDKHHLLPYKNSENFISLVTIYYGLKVTVTSLRYCKFTGLSRRKFDN